MHLASYRPLGRSGLIVSPFALGAMTFSTQGWGASDDVSHAILQAYVAAGGNFIDTADIYAAGRSEEIVGRSISALSLRDKIVLATKFTWNSDSGNPNAGGNGRKNIYRALDASLKRLQTDYIDLYWLHFWDMVTPVEEVLQTLGDLVRVGKLRYFALSDVPAWYATKMAVLAQIHGLPGPIAMQMEYSLVERTVEREHLGAARECGLGLIPWSPLAGGFLTGKYRAENQNNAGATRLSGANPFGDSKFTARNWSVLEVLQNVAKEIGRPPAQIALAWALTKPGISSVLIGATTPSQLSENIAALEVTLTKEHLATLDNASALDAAFPYAAFTADTKRRIFGGAEVQA